MLIQEINCSVNSYTLSGEVIVPSSVLTSTKQDEVGYLEKSPNFQIKLSDTYSYMNIDDNVYVEFTNGDRNYTAYMDVVNKQQNGVVTLQYVDGLTYSDSPVPPGPEPPAYTFAFENSRYECSAVYNGSTTEYTDAVVMFNVNGNLVFLSPSEVSISGVGSSLARYMALNDPDDGTYGFRCTAQSNISTTVTVTATYNGMTATTTLVLRRSENIPDEPTVDPELSESINNILGSNYDVINDMSEEDALAAANNILYGDEEPPK